MRALRTEKNRAEHKTFSAVNWIWGVAMAVLMVALIFTVWFTGIRITDPGMSPTLYPGDGCFSISSPCTFPCRSAARPMPSSDSGNRNRPHSGAARRQNWP